MHMHATHASHSSKQVKTAALVATFAATIISSSTLIVFFFTHSYVIGLAALESTIDVIVSFTNAQIIQFARKDADENHPYGHGRAESIASLGQASLMAGGALVMCYLAISHLFRLYRTDNFLLKTTTTPWLILFFAVFCCISFSVSWWLKKQGKRFNSPALLSDAGHYFVDFLTNLSTTVALSLIIFVGYDFLDPLLALIFAGVILRVAYKIFHDNVADLMDRDIPVRVKNEAYEIIMTSHPQIIDIHKFRGRRSGHRYFFDFHITLPDELSFYEVHEIIETVEKRISERFDGDVNAHADPKGIRTDSIPKYSPENYFKKT